MFNIGLYSPSMQMGKSTTAKYLIKKYNYETVILAGTLKKMLAVLYADLGIDEETIQRMLYGDLKEVDIEELNTTNEDGTISGVTSRHLMQTIGTEWGRTYAHRDIWIKTATKNLIKGQPYVSEDIRFINEAEAFRKAGFKIVQLVNPRVPIIRGHASEGELDNYNFDYTIVNDGSFDRLYYNIDVMLKELV